MALRSFLLFTLVLGTLAGPVEAQFGRGLPRYRAQERRTYQFGFTTTYEVCVLNSSLQDLEFRLAEYKNELQKWAEPDSGWIVPAGSFGSTKVMALEMGGYFVTRRGVRVPAVVKRGAYYATFSVDEELLREYESRDPKGAIVIRTFEGFKNPDIPKKRLTVSSDRLARLRRSLAVLPGPYERPGREGAYAELDSGSFEKPEEGKSIIKTNPDDQVGSSSGRIRQPGEELLTVSVVRESGEIPFGARFSARIGHDYAHRTETGQLDGEGRLRLFTTRDEAISIAFELSGAAVGGTARFTIAPSVDTNVSIRIP